LFLSIIQVRKRCLQAHAPNNSDRSAERVSQLD
jgi:hypothetical protein